MTEPAPPAAAASGPAPPRISYRNRDGVSHLAMSCDFASLRSAHPEFRRAWDGIRRGGGRGGRGGGPLGSRADHAFNAALSRALVLDHFGLVLPSLPEGRLCPTIPNRSNYVRWLRDLVAGSRVDLARFADGTRGIARRGLDIGAGASAVYPLLLTTGLFADSDELRGDDGPGRAWRFLATEIDPAAVESARTNVDANGLGDAIRVERVDGGDGPLDAALAAAGRGGTFARGNGDGAPLFDFAMTNPPFYSTREEAREPRAGDKRPRTGMSGNECVYAPRDGGDAGDGGGGAGGGDAGFASAIMRDSMSHRTDVTWYTSLVARKTSLSALLLGKLQELPGVWGNRGQVRSVEFRQGNIKGESGEDDDCKGSERVRWGVAWTYERASDRCAACLSDAGVRPFRVELDGEEAVRRLGAFVDGFREHELRRRSVERRSRSDADGAEDGRHRCLTVVEARFGERDPADPPAAHGILPQDNSSLPGCGHFLLDIFVISDAKTGEGSAAATIVVEAFCHTRLGESMARKIAAQLPGEVTRSNRRWRRLLKRGLDPG